MLFRSGLTRDGGERAWVDKCGLDDPGKISEFREDGASDSWKDRKSASDAFGGASQRASDRLNRVERVPLK